MLPSTPTHTHKTLRPPASPPPPPPPPPHTHTQKNPRIKHIVGPGFTWRAISFTAMILSRNELLTIAKGNNCVGYLLKLTRVNPNLNLVNINAYLHLGQIPSNCSQYTERKRKYNNNTAMVLGYCYIFVSWNNPNRDVVKVNTYAKFDQIPWIHSQDIEQKQNPHDNQGP